MQTEPIPVETGEDSAVRQCFDLSRTAVDIGRSKEGTRRAWLDVAETAARLAASPEEGRDPRFAVAMALKALDIAGEPTDESVETAYSELQSVHEPDSPAVSLLSGQLE